LDNDSNNDFAYYERQSALELYGHSNGEVVSHVWLSPGDSITFSEDGTHSPYTEGTNKVTPINKKKGKKVGIGSLLAPEPQAQWKNHSEPDTKYQNVPRYESVSVSEDLVVKMEGGKWFDPPVCIDVKGKFVLVECLIETLPSGAEVSINPELPQYIPEIKFVVELRSGGLRVETDTDEFLTVITPSSGHAGCIIPEFTTIAIPVAAILGIVFLISRRKRKE
jgi:hypothetical protein